MYESLSEAEQLVARFIEQHPEAVVRMASRALAQRIGVSEATITRCSQSLGELKHSPRLILELRNQQAIRRGAEYLAGRGLAR
jgi:DNA-binding MurR/RpiR family transcriptional regulator